MKERPKVGVGVCIIKEGKVLLGKRINAHGHGTWAFPGGHLEFGETVFECARREVAEEAGIQVTNIRRGPYTEDLYLAENKHYITLILIADWLAGEPVVLEPDKCEQWQWFEWSALPAPLFKTFSSLDEAAINLQNFI